MRKYAIKFISDVIDDTEIIVEGSSTLDAAAKAFDIAGGLAEALGGSLQLLKINPLSRTSVLN